MFNPLTTIREVRSDHQLTSTEKLVLICAALRADNQTSRVHASQEILAEDAGLTRRTVVRVLQSQNVARYLTIVKVHRRRTDLVWRSVSVTPRVTQLHTECDSVSHLLPLSTSTSKEEEASMTLAPVAPLEPQPAEYPDKNQYLEAHMVWQIDNLDWIMAHKQDH